MTATAADVDGYLAEDEVLADARARGRAAGAAPVSAGTGAALALLAATTAARAVVEIGTGCGVSGLWLLRGMAADGTLTSIDVDPELQRAARRSFLDAGHGPGRLRLINGLALEVLPRLTDGGYDLVLVDVARSGGGARIAAGAADYPDYLAEAIRLLRPGGILVLDGVLVGGGREVTAGTGTNGDSTGGTAPDGPALDAGAVDAGAPDGTAGPAADGDPAHRAAAGLREAARLVREDERLVPALLPLGDGLLVATRR
ncbi:O-methyltransferase [Pseudonocardia yuanmonensis]|uniref:O-methyltransferase n=1 Tax=Pseudonocardia yuanmonensis TaxID=1095914 RepID=A0ABP8WIY5_9PSEU